MSIGEEMGLGLGNTAYWVNIKERLDFSWALFDQQGQLIANAPHMPVHLGSMGESVRAVIVANRGRMKAGNVYVLNAPYNGGTHLPDVTVITPVFDDAGEEILFYVGSRGHHADIGGITPGSMPPRRMVAHFGLEVVYAYMRHVQDNAEEAVRRVIGVLKDGDFVYEMDNGGVIRVKITIRRDARGATIDFTGPSPQLPDNFNAPAAVCMAAVLYVFRTLVDDEIPMNAGCLKPLEVIIPEGSMLRA